MSKQVVTLPISTATTLTAAQVSNGRMIVGSGTTTITMPAASALADGQDVRVDAIGANITVAAGTGATIDGGANITLTADKVTSFWYDKANANWRTSVSA